MAAPAWANMQGMSFDCSEHPEQCVTVAYNNFVDDLSQVQAASEKQRQAIEKIAADNKLGKTALQRKNSSVVKDQQSGSWQISESLTYALDNSTAAAAFTALLQAEGYSIGESYEGESC